MAQLSTSGGGGGFASGSSGGGKFDWGSIIGAGVQLAGGLLNSRGARQANQMSRESLREQMQQDALLQRERLRAEMQTRQDDYQREVTRNRRAISPYRQMYSGPRFQFAEGQGPDAPIYNPLMEQGSLYQQLGQAPQMPWQQQQQPPRRG
jgi:hypothetical protein